MPQPPPQQGPPYTPTTATLGGVPTITTDIPIAAVLISIYGSFAITNMTILQLNLRRGHKFIVSGVMFGFCMARIATLVLRIAWATRQHNARLAIAAQILMNAGVLLIYIVNLLLAQRMLRAKQPHIGWNPVLRAAYKVLYFSIAGALAMVIISIVVTVYTLNQHIRIQCRDIQLAAITYLLVFTTLPVWHFAASFLLPRHKNEETFGAGRMRSKMIVLAISTGLCMTIAGFKAGTAWMPPRPATDPAWYHSKASFYVFNFTLEILALATLTIARIDKRFHIPNGSKQAGDYTRRRKIDAREGEGEAEVSYAIDSPQEERSVYEDTVSRQPSKDSKVEVHDEKVEVNNEKVEVKDERVDSI